MASSGVNIERHSHPHSVTKNADGSLTYTFKQKGEEKKSQVDCVLFAIGRQPNTGNL